MKDILNIAKEILNLNKTAYLTGTLMLKLRGIDLGREPKDIDILVNDYATNIILPKKWKNIEHLGFSSDGSGVKYRYNNVIIDIMSSNETPEMINGFNLASVEGLMKAKYIYSQQNNVYSKKHLEDLKKMGFKFPKEFNIETDELPF